MELQMKYEWFKSQFHYGSIKTITNKIIETDKKVSQFHYGSIKTRKILINNVVKYIISIPLWFD